MKKYIYLALVGFFLSTPIFARDSLPDFDYDSDCDSDNRYSVSTYISVAGFDASADGASFDDPSDKGILGGKIKSRNQNGPFSKKYTKNKKRKARNEQRKAAELQRKRDLKRGLKEKSRILTQARLRDLLEKEDLRYRYGSPAQLDEADQSLPERAGEDFRHRFHAIIDETDEDSSDRTDGNSLCQTDGRLDLYLASGGCDSDSRCSVSTYISRADSDKSFERDLGFAPYNKSIFSGTIKSQKLENLLSKGYSRKIKKPEDVETNKSVIGKKLKRKESAKSRKIARSWARREKKHLGY